MSENNRLKVIKFPMKLLFNRYYFKTKFIKDNEAIKVTLIDYPKGNFKEHCAKMILSTWRENPNYKLSKNKVNKIFMDLLMGKTLTNSMESLVFTFLLEGLTHVEISHLLRHRSMFSIHALCSGDRDLRDDDIMIPSSILKSEFANEYKQLSLDCKNLYCKMIDSKNISLMDARYILNRNHLYYYYVSMNLKDIIYYINQRKCSAVQPYTDNLIAKGIYDNVIKIIPELKKVLSLKCDKSCHFVRSDISKNTRLYLPDKTHDKLFEYNKKNFIYNKRRHEMGIPKGVQDES